MINFLSITVLLVLTKSSFQASSVNSKSYIGAVVDYHPVVDGENGQIVAEKNADIYQNVTKTASEYNIDIIVFPESGITSLPKYGPREEQFNATDFRAFYRDVASYVPRPDELVVPCDVDGKYKQSLRKISCAAREHKMYVVANHHEIMDCSEPNCVPDDFLLYNTNVVFDRNGKVIARYRKYNLYNEDGTNITTLPEYSTFTTDFGVTFGQLICADIYHQTPAKFYVKNPNVTDVVFSTHWFNDLPFIDGVQQQAGWSYGADVNFLGSNYNRARTGSGGSGIYAGRNGPLILYHSLKASNALIIAEIPKLQNGKRVDDLKVSEPTVIELSEILITEKPVFEKNFHNPYLSLYKSEGLDLQKSHTNTTICDRGLCCNFNVKTNYDEKLVNENAKKYSYRFFVFNGVEGTENDSTSTKGLEICSMVACRGNSIEGCGGVYSRDTMVVYPTNFLSLSIVRRVNTSEHVLYEPSTLTLKRRLPLDGKDFTYNFSEPDSNNLNMSLVTPQSDLMVFGVWARRFDRDGSKLNDL